MLKTPLLLFVVIATHLSVAAQGFRSDAEKLDLIEKAAQPWNAVHRWLIEYDCVIRPNRQNSHVRMIMAMGAPGEYYKLKAKGFAHIPWQADPFTEESFIHGGVRCIRWPINRMYREIPMQPGDEIEGTISGDILWRVVPVCPLTQYRLLTPGDLQVSPILDRALRSAHFRLLDGSESVNGETCLVFVLNASNAVRKTWIATRLGLCVMKDEDRYPSSNGLARRLVVDEIGEVAPGLRLPVRYRFQRFRGGTNENDPEREVSVRILRCLLNDDVPASTFVPTHAAGSIKEVRKGEDVQVSPGGEDLLLDRVQFMKKYAPPTKASSVQAYMWAIAGLTCGLVLGLLVFQHKGQATKATVLANKVTEQTVG